MKRILLFAAFFSVYISLPAQNNHLKFDRISIREGLPDRRLTCMTQDSSGYIWMGTQNGLMRYDGYKSKVYRFGLGSDAPFTNCSVFSMAVDSRNNLWVSTLGNGLFRYDRSTDSFIEYPYHKGPITVEFIAAIDGNGDIWLYEQPFNSMHTRLVKFNTRKKAFEYFDARQKGNYHLDVGDVFSVTKTSDGTIWAGTDNGLYRYNPKKNNFQAYQVTSTGRNYVGPIYEAPSEKGVIWFSDFVNQAKQRLVRLDTRTGTFKYYNDETVPGLQLTNKLVRAIIEDSKHRLWFGSAAGMLGFDRGTGRFSGYFPIDTGKNSEDVSIKNITSAADGTLWLSQGPKLINFNGDTHKFAVYKLGSGTFDPQGFYNINTVLIDRSGILWVSMGFDGSAKVNPLTSAVVAESGPAKKPGDYAGGAVKYSSRTPDGQILFRTDKGVYKWQPGTEEFKLICNTTKSDVISSAIAQGRDGKVYIGSDGGLQVYDPSQNTTRNYHFDKKDTTSLANNSVSAILEDHTGKVWVGSFGGGISSFDAGTGKFKRYPFITNYVSIRTKHGELDDRNVMTIYEDREGTLWVGTNNGGANRFDRKTGKFQSYLYDGKKRVVSASNFLEDSKGRMWIGTYLDGLYLFDRKTEHYINHFDENNGLLLNTVAGLEEDKRGFIWINSDRGFTRLNPQDMSLKTYPLTTVLPGKKWNLSLNNFSSASGIMTVGLTDGIAWFDPADLAGSSYPPDVHIERVGYSNPASAKDSSTYLDAYGRNNLELPHDQNRITINYTALHFAEPEENRYSYFLKGFDKHWTEAGHARSVTYTNLPPGTYTFQVRAANSDGVWNNKGDSYTFIIHAPWWERWWAWLIYIALFVTAIYAFVAYRSRKLIHDKHVLEQEVKVRTEEVLQQKEEIEAQRDNLEKAFGELKTTQNQLIQAEKMASLGELTAGIAHEIQNPLNFVNNFSEVSMELAGDLKDELKSGNTEEALALADDIEQNLGKIRHHGKRADGIVKGMLEHSRTSSGQKESVDINKLADEYLRLAYHGLRAKDKSFNAELITNFDKHLPKVNVVSQDLGRVLLNLFNNAFYAVSQKQKTAGADYKPIVEVTTSGPRSPKGGAETILVSVRDNGTGIPDKIKDKIMQPFFTTKPTGEGTGLGLSLSYDIVVKGHGGTIDLKTTEGEGAEFIVFLPLT